MNETVSRLMEANLLGVFNERDGKRRAAAIRSTYAPDVRWTDDAGVSVGHEALEARAQGLQQHSQGLVFTKASPVYQTLDFGYLAWHLGPKGGDPVTSGFDVAIVRNDAIAELYTVITSRIHQRLEPGPKCRAQRTSLRRPGRRTCRTATCADQGSAR
jgi:hypothetical protein